MAGGVQLFYSVDVLEEGGGDHGQSQPRHGGETSRQKKHKRVAEEEEDAPSITFSSGNPKIEVSHGFIHLFHVRSASARGGVAARGVAVEDAVDAAPPSSSNDPPLPAAARLFQPALPAPSPGSARRDPLPRSRGLVLLALRIPDVVSMSDLLDKTKAFHDHLTTMRIVKRALSATASADVRAGGGGKDATDGDGKEEEVREEDDDDGTNSYMALISFRSQKWADDFFLSFNGMPFNSLEPDLWRLLFVRDVEDVDGPKGGKRAARRARGSDGRSKSSDVGASESNDSAKAHPGGHTEKQEEEGKEATGDDDEVDDDECDDDEENDPVELPTCPVCLELLDSDISGIVTTVCNHSFHAACLGRWNQHKCWCPVCKFHATTGAHPTRRARPSCAKCDCDDNLWMCLLCGYVGCGRYKHRHAIDHYHETQHNYSLDIDTGRIWDYKGDNYVHRMMQSKTEGMKIIELPIPSTENNNNAADSDNPQASERRERRRGRRVSEQLTGAANAKREDSGDGAAHDDGEEEYDKEDEEEDRICDAEIDALVKNGDTWQTVRGKGKRASELGRLAAARAASSLNTRRKSTMLSQFEIDDDDGHIDTLASTKFEVFAFEYEHLLAAQLESQRLFYEEQLGKEQEAHAAQRSELMEEHDRIERERQGLANEIESLKVLLKESEASMRSLEKRLTTAATATKEVETLRLLNDSLVANQKELRTRHEREQLERAEESRRAQASIDDLQEQVNDLMVFLDAKSKIEGGEMEGGSIATLTPPASNGDAKRHGSSAKGKGRRR